VWCQIDGSGAALKGSDSVFEDDVQSTLKRNHKQDEMTDRIVDGERAPSGRYPWYVIVGEIGSFNNYWGRCLSGNKLMCVFFSRAPTGL